MGFEAIHGLNGMTMTVGYGRATVLTIGAQVAPFRMSRVAVRR